MTSDELLDCLRRIGWSIHELSRRTGVRHARAVDWAHGRQPAPHAIADWLRQVAQLIEANPAPVHERKRSHDVTHDD